MIIYNDVSPYEMNGGVSYETHEGGHIIVAMDLCCEDGSFFAFFEYYYKGAISIWSATFDEANHNDEAVEKEATTAGINGGKSGK